MAESKIIGECTRPAPNEMHRNQDGWIAADLHVHSSCSPDVLCFPEFHPEAIYQKANAMGMGFITIFPILNSLLVLLTKSGLFSSLYLTSQKITAHRIQWLLPSQVKQNRNTVQKGFSYEPIFTDID